MKAIVKFIDGAGRIVCLTEKNDTALVSIEVGDAIPNAGDTVELIRKGEEGKNRRITDWSMAK